MKRTYFAPLAATFCLAALHLHAQGTVFPYSGELDDNNLPASGNYDIRFTLYDSRDQSTVVAGPLQLNAVVVVKGEFAVTLDFGNTFDGSQRWLEIEVRTNDNAGTFTTLAPRVPILPTPYANTAQKVSGTVDASQIGGAFHLVPGANGPNLVAGSDNNSVGTGVSGATIAGGGDPNGAGNAVNADKSTVSGGAGNIIGNNASAATVSGGQNNNIQSGAASANIAGGDENEVKSGAMNSVIGGGHHNSVNSVQATICGGKANTIADNADNATVSGGQNNNIDAGAVNANIGGGDANEIKSDAMNSVVAGGRNNIINGIAGTVCGGVGNTVGSLADNSSIGGGQLNQANAANCTVGGGSANIASGVGAVIPGGLENNAVGANSFAAGMKAKAMNDGSFVWSDGNGGSDFASTGNNQFLVHANGGVGINVNNPTEAMQVGGNVKADSFIGDGSQLTGVNAVVADGGVATAKLADNAVTQQKIADGSVNTTKLVDGSVATAKMADGSVTTTKLADTSVATAKLMDNAVTQQKIADASVVSAKLVDSAVTTAKLSDSSVSAPKLASGSVDATKLAAGAPSANQVLTYSGSALAWMTPSGGGGPAWLLSGNSGTDPNVNFLGTTDNQALTLRVNNLAALRLLPQFVTGGPYPAPSLIGGSSMNQILGILSDSPGSIIAGGGVSYEPQFIAGTSRFATISGGSGNTITNNQWATIGGGEKNVITAASSSYNTIGGGNLNRIYLPASDQVDGNTIAGGEQNSIKQSANNTHIRFAFIGSGLQNTNATEAGVIGGGKLNLIQVTQGESSFIGAGNGNAIYASYSGIAAGQNNRIFKQHAYIGGGTGNVIGSSGGSDDQSVIGGGYQNFLDGTSACFIGGGRQNTNRGSGNFIGCGELNLIGPANVVDSTIAGGLQNTNATWNYAAIGGGQYNLISGNLGTIPGGANNEAGGFCFAAGFNAKARNTGSFVWADSSSGTEFASTASYQYLMRATGGVGINTNNPHTALEVNGSVTLSGTLNLPATTAAAGIIYSGGNTLLHAFGTNNFFAGPTAGNLTQINSSQNTGIGASALQTVSGKTNIALGYRAGNALTTGDNNIDIGNQGVAAESGTIRIGTQGTQTNTFIAGISGATAASGVAVYVGPNGQLGTLTSSARFKRDIQSMDDASDVLLSLRPVTFRYKPELDPQAIPQFGLVAEEVNKVDPDLVARDNQNQIYTVRYEAVNAMLLNEFLKQHRKVEEQNRKVEQQNSEIQTLKERLERLEQLIRQQGGGAQ